ncbi:MAG: hypothetical protein ACK44G_09590 [Aphanizomenon sp.]
MLPKSSTDLLVSEASDSTSMTVDFVTNEPWSIESYAEGLMDELFTDIDNILDGRNQRNYSRDRKESVPVQTMTFKIPDVVLSSTVNIPLQSALPIKNIQAGTLVVNPSSMRAINTDSQSQPNILGKLIFMGLGLTTATLGMVYLTDSGLLTTIISQLTSQSLSNPQIPSSVAVKADSQLDLVNYMLGALNVIEQRETSNDKITIKPGFPNGDFNQITTATLPVPVAANNVPPVTNRLISPNVVERIYIPVYQSPAPKYQIPTVPAVPIPKTLPSPSSLAVNNPLINVKKPAIKSIEKPSQVKPSPVAVNTQPLKVAPSNLPTIAPVPAKEPTNMVQQDSVPIYSAQLDGLLELGNKSVALFKVDGISRRISLGENIGYTGWVLVEVSNGEARIRRNGEVRSIYTGQKL